jgi:hypothetical protein
LAADGARSTDGDLAMARYRDRTLGLRTAPDIMASTAAHTLAAVSEQMLFELAKRRHLDAVSRLAIPRSTL